MLCTRSGICTLLLFSLRISCTIVLVISRFPGSSESSNMHFSLSPSSRSSLWNRERPPVGRLPTVRGGPTLYSGIPLLPDPVLDPIPRKVDERMRRKKLSNCFRSAGRDATSIPTESSDADQMARLTPSHVGSAVFINAESSTVFATEQAVALMAGSVDVNANPGGYLHKAKTEDDAQTPLSTPW